MYPMKEYKKCLIIVDMVNGFINEGILHDKKIGRIIPRQKEIIEQAKLEGRLIIIIKDTHSHESVEFARFGNTEHCLENTKESELIDELKDYEFKGDTISIKKNSTSFMEVPDFRKLMEEQTKIIEFDIVGCCTDICVVNGTIGLANYLDQHNRKHIINVHEDGIATYQEEERQEYVDAAILLMKQQGINILKKEV